MDYEFFFSYTRANYDDYLRRFFTDLSQAIRDARGLPQSAEVGFLDQRDLELGTRWEKEIQAALETTRTMVCLYSPSYFRSAYCGREWRAFYDRCEQSVRQGTYRDLPPLVKPVLWITPLPTDLPRLVADLQYGKGDPASVINQRGLKYVMKQMATYSREYVDYVTDLAREIREAVDGYPLPALQGGLPPLAEVEPAFPAASAATCGAAAAGPPLPQAPPLLRRGSAPPDLPGDPSSSLLAWGPMPSQEIPKGQVFISYSRHDEKLKSELLTHLKPYLRSGAVTAWSDEQIAAGSKWFEGIQVALAKTSVAVLLVSPHFLASDFIHANELMPLLKEAEAGGVKILWVQLRASAYAETRLKDYQAVVSPPGKPLAEMKANRDHAWVRLCEEIKKAINS